MKHLTLSVMAIVGIIQILQNAIMMEVIVVDLMLTRKVVLTVYATQSTVMVHRNSYQMVTAMMKPTMQTATMMEVTVVERVPTQTIVQIVSVMQSLRLIPIVSKHL